MPIDPINSSWPVVQPSQLGPSDLLRVYGPNNPDLVFTSALGLSSALGFANVKDYGAVGDGVTDDTVALQYFFDTVWKRRVNYPGFGARPIAFFPPGIYNVSSPILLESVDGALMMGCGRFSSQIFDTTGLGIFKTNGFAFCTISELYLHGFPGGTKPVFDLDWDNLGPVSLQSNTFFNVIFAHGTHGLRIGNSGFMGSETMVLNCFFAETPIGIETCNANALQQSVIGGNMQSCTTGILVTSGSVPKISGVGFQLSSGYDIDIAGGVGWDTTKIDACRSESPNFIRCAAGTLSIDSCLHVGTGNGDFLIGASISAEISNCTSQYGVVNPGHGLGGGVRINNSEFGRSLAQWLDTSLLNLSQRVYLKQVAVGGLPSLGQPHTLYSDVYFERSSSFRIPDVTLDPRSVPMLQAYYEPSDNTTITYGVAPKFSQILDLSTNVNHLTQAVAANQASIVASSTGKNVMRFTAANSVKMAMTAPVACTNGFTIIAVVSRSGPAGTNVIETFGNSGVAAAYGLSLGADGNVYGATADYYNGFAATAGTGWEVLAISGIGNQISGYFNSSTSNAIGAAIPVVASLTFDQVGNGDSTYCNGDIGSLCIFNSVLPESNIRAIMNYFCALYGIVP